MACDIKLNRDQTYNSTGSKFQESDKWLLNRGQWLVLQFGYSRSWKLNEWRLSKTLINESVFQWDWASVKKASSTAAILSSSMKPLIQNDMGSSRLISSTSVLILDKNVKKKNACWMCTKHYCLEISKGFIYEQTNLMYKVSHLARAHGKAKRHTVHVLSVT